MISWDSAPLEVEQSNVIPEFWDSEGRAESEPKSRTKYEGDLVVNDIRWMEPNEGEHTLCWTGMSDRYQTYSFTGSKTIMGVGSTTPEEFTGDATWDTGSSQVEQRLILPVQRPTVRYIVDGRRRCLNSGRQQPGNMMSYRHHHGCLDSCFPLILLLLLEHHLSSCHPFQ